MSNPRNALVDPFANTVPILVRDCDVCDLEYQEKMKKRKRPAQEVHEKIQKFRAMYGELQQDLSKFNKYSEGVEKLDGLLGKDSELKAEVTKVRDELEQVLDLCTTQCSLCELEGSEVAAAMTMPCCMKSLCLKDLFKVNKERARIKSITGMLKISFKCPFCRELNKLDGIDIGKTLYVDGMKV